MAMCLDIVALWAQILTALKLSLLLSAGSMDGHVEGEKSAVGG
jgi:hypothetical protein